jgi:Tol biopolymer transport system component
MRNGQFQGTYWIALIVAVSLNLLIVRIAGAQIERPESRSSSQYVVSLPTVPSPQQGQLSPSPRAAAPVGPTGTVSEKLLAHIDSSDLLDSSATSPDLRRFAYVVRSEAEHYVFVDGQRQKSYNAIGKGYPFVDSNGSLVNLGNPIFSPDSKRVSYLAQEGYNDKWIVVVDGQEQKPYDDIGGLTLLFSPNSKQVAYVVAVGSKQCVVVDGEEHKLYDWIGDLTFSPDSRRLAYWAGSKGRRLVVVDGEEGKRYDGVAQGEGPRFMSWDSPWVAGTSFPIAFSANSLRVAYSAVLGSDVFAVVDGKEQNAYNGVRDGPLFSPDSRRVAYVVYSAGWKSVVVDGQKQKPYEEIGEGSLVFSPSSRRIAYAVCSREKWFAVVDGKESGPYDDFIWYPFFSPNSRRVAYVTHRWGPGNLWHSREGEKFFAVADGNAGKAYCDIREPTFSPDSRRFAYVARQDDKWLVVVNGNEQKAYDEIGEESLTFSPDSRRFAYWARSGGKWFVVVDGTEGKSYGDLLDPTIIFDSATTVRYLAVSQAPLGKDIYLVEDTID